MAASRIWAMTLSAGRRVTPGVGQARDRARIRTSAESDVRWGSGRSGAWPAARWAYAGAVTRQRRCRGEDERLHRGRSGKVVVALGVGEGQELLEFLVGLEDVSGEVAGGWIGLMFLAARSSAAESRGRAGAPAELSAPDVLTGTLAGWNSWPLSGVSRPWHLRVRSASAAGRGSPGCLRGNLPSCGRERAGGSNSPGD